MRWSEREKRLGILLALSGVVLVSLVCYIIFEQEQGPVATFPPYEEPKADIEMATPDATRQAETVQTEVVVDVKGAVQHPGVYALPAGARVIDAVERAGGFLPEADPDRINLAQPLTDGMAFRVPFQGEEAGAGGLADVSSTLISSPVGNSGSGKVNINTATASELETLPGIGPAKAEAIIQYRTEHGPFQHVDQLLEVPGIGEKTLQNLRDFITVH